MLYSLDTPKPTLINSMPHKGNFDLWRSRVSDSKYQAIKDELNSQINAGKLHTSSWMPGSNWMGTVFEPIYTDACSLNQDAAALFFGLILWEVMMEREESWSFGRYAVGEIPIKGLTYFQI